MTEYDEQVKIATDFLIAAATTIFGTAVVLIGGAMVLFGVLAWLRP